jgi:hypothetical protein
VNVRAAAVVLVALCPALASCDQTASDPASMPASSPSATATSPTGSSAAPVPSEQPRQLKGGGYAAAVPGSDAPDRKVLDGGPVIPLTEGGPDIKEIERLVREVEKIVKARANSEPEESGGSVAAAVGTFSYRYFADGSIQPDLAWVRANITTESVPLLGTVRCHAVALPQLRGALQEVVDRGLADEIRPGEYAGCYVPRFIDQDPGQGLSLHSWGIAVDLNVPGNLRGTTGQINRDVVAIFKKWGFAWGGDWSYTDPMHFELSRLVTAGSH